MNAPGKGILKVTSILFIIFGALDIVLSLIGLAGSALLTSVAASYGSTVVTAVAGILLVLLIVALALSALYLVVGILGVKKSDDPSKASFFITWGIVLCVLQLISLIITTISSSFPFLGFIGFVLPILYIVGGYQNKNAKAAPTA
jgi:hypothetical protein